MTRLPHDAGPDAKPQAEHALAPVPTHLPEVAPPAYPPSLGRIGFVGAGAVASSLARALAAAGARIVAVTSRSSAKAEALAALLPGAQAVASPAEVAARSHTVFLAVPDDAIAPVAEGIAWRAGQAALHLSGARGLAPLAAAAAQSARVAALHPLMTFPVGVRDWPLARVLVRFSGCTWALEANDPALGSALEGLVAALGGRVVRLSSEQRVPYHLAAVLASNYVVALLGAAVELWRGLGVAPDEALAALLPLTRAAVESLEALGLPAALTGPVARGDIGTIAAHLQWLQSQRQAHPHAHPDQSDSESPSPLGEAYVSLARLALPLALAKGALSPDAAEALRALLTSFAPPGDASGDAVPDMP